MLFGVRENFIFERSQRKGKFSDYICILFLLLLLFSNILKSFVHFTDMNHVVLVGYFSLD